MKDEKFVLDPDFQRDFIWTVDKQSRLIESMLMRIPLPVFYLAETDEGTTVVVDGLQRLTTFRRFLDGKFAFRNLELAKQLNGRYFSDLSAKLQNRLEDTQLILYLIDPKVPEQAKLDIFDRVNGGVPLTRQQMRNSIYSGPSTLWLKSAVSSNEFVAATAKSLDWRSMRDRECVNRFAAFNLFGVDSYEAGDMDSFLAGALKELNKRPHHIERLDASFRRSMRNNLLVFGQHAFRKHRTSHDRRSVINVALFDVFSVLMADLDEKVVLSTKARIQEAFFRLMDDREFLDSITISTNSTRKVQKRFGLAMRSLEGIANAG